MKRTINDVFDDFDVAVEGGRDGGFFEGDEPTADSLSSGNMITFNRTSQLSVPLPDQAGSNNSAFCGINWNSFRGGGRGGDKEIGLFLQLRL